MKKIVRWTQVYETVVDLPADRNMNNLSGPELLDLNTKVKGAVAQEDTFEILDITDVGFRKPHYAWNVARMEEVTSDAYSANLYTSWPAVCRVLKVRGFEVREAEAILRSRWVRWASDGRKGSARPTSTAMANYLDSGSGILPGDRAVAELVAGYGEDDFKY